MLFALWPPWHYPPTPFQPPLTLNYSGEGGLTVISSAFQSSSSINNVTGSWQPTYVSHSTSGAQDSLVFHLKFIEGNVSVCLGCRNKYNKNAKEPHNMFANIGVASVYSSLKLSAAILLGQYLLSCEVSLCLFEMASFSTTTTCANRIFCFAKVVWYSQSLHFVWTWIANVMYSW